MSKTEQREGATNDAIGGGFPVRGEGEEWRRVWGHDEKQCV
jgi:hypothetical protein